MAVNTSHCWQAKLMRRNVLELRELVGKSVVWEGDEMRSRVALGRGEMGNKPKL